MLHIKNLLGKTVQVIPASVKGKPIHGITFAQGPGCTWWVMRKDGKVQCVPQGDLVEDNTAKDVNYMLDINHINYIDWYITLQWQLANTNDISAGFSDE